MNEKREFWNHAKLTYFPLKLFTELKLSSGWWKSVRHQINIEEKRAIYVA